MNQYDSVLFWTVPLSGMRHDMHLDDGIGELLVAYPAIANGLSLLYKSHLLSESVAKNPWLNSVEIAQLQRLGVDRVELRWLIQKGIVTHAVELKPPNENARAFQTAGIAQFYKHSCFALTTRGVQLVEALLRDSVPKPSDRQMRISGRRVQLIACVETPTKTPTPCWDAQKRELRVGEIVVKKFRRPATNQMVVLSAFQEEGWPSRIDDPIPPADEVDAKRRLRATIFALNQLCCVELVSFFGDGTGNGIGWRYNSSTNPPENSEISD